MSFSLNTSVGCLCSQTRGMDTAAGWEGGRAPSSVDLLDKCLNLSLPEGSELRQESQSWLSSNPNYAVIALNSALIYEYGLKRTDSSKPLFFNISQP